MTRAPSHDRLAAMANDARQLCESFTVPVRRRARGGRTVWIGIRHPPLLVQMYTAILPGNQPKGAERHRVPESREPGNISTVTDAFTLLLDGDHRPGMWEWRKTLGLSPMAGPHPVHNLLWYRATLFGIVGLAPTLAPSIADDLADDMHRWWRVAAHFAGLDLDTLLAGR